MTIDGLVIGLCGFVIGYATPAGVGIRPWFDVLGWLQKTALVLSITSATVCSAYLLVMKTPLMFHPEAFVIGLVLGGVTGLGLCYLSAIARPFEPPKPPRSPSYFFENSSDTLH